jgi:hypothetical protein
MPAVSWALTAQEVLLLKQNGVSEATIQMMLQSEMQARSIRAGTDADGLGVRTIVRPAGEPAIVYTTGRGDQDRRTAEERRKEDRAWEMLRHLIVDTRTAAD